jgi:hypothetical protein
MDESKLLLLLRQKRTSILRVTGIGERNTQIRPTRRRPGYLALLILEGGFIGVTLRAKQLEVAPQMFLPIPANSRRPRHQFVSRTSTLDAIEFQVLDLTATFATATQQLDKFGA